jgi:small subunit ribosomal protein S9
VAAEAKAKPAKIYVGTGRRKTSVARVRVTDGPGKVEINGRPLDGFFTEPKDRNAVVAPLDAVELRGKLDISVQVRGGGITGQSGAISQGVARALKTMFTPPPSATPADGETPAIPAQVKKLRDGGFLTRDARMKERKKYGRRGARRSFQFSKR